jgi:biopolymer transport protein ExbD
MAMTTGNAFPQKAQINVTPMIDVLLVLIIIFMVITPLTPTGLNTLLPQPSTTDPPTRAREIVVSIDSDYAIRLNREPVELAELHGRLSELVKHGVANHIFVRGDRGLEFRKVVQVLDIARGAGWDRVGLMTQ